VVVVAAAFFYRGKCICVQIKFTVGLLIFLALGQGVRPSYNRVPDDQSSGGGQSGAGQPDSGDMDNLQAGDEIRKNNNNSCIKIIIEIFKK